MKVICIGGSRDRWVGAILHGRKIIFPTEPRAEYEIIDTKDKLGRNICVPIHPEQ